MDLRAPVLVGGMLAGGVAYADEPVTIEPIDGGVKVAIAESGVSLYARDKSTILALRPPNLGVKYNDFEVQYRLTLDAQGVDFDRVEVVKGQVLGLKTEWITSVVGGRGDRLEVDLIGNAGVEQGGEAALVSVEIGDGEIAIDDHASGVRVVLTTNGIKADAVDMPFMEVVGSFFANPPKDLALSASHVEVRDLDVDRLVLFGESSGLRVSGLKADELHFEGTHYGVSLGGGIIDYLQADGVLTGAALPGTVIGEYVGPRSFQASPPLTVIIKDPGGIPTK